MNILKKIIFHNPSSGGPGVRSPLGYTETFEISDDPYCLISSYPHIRYVKNMNGRLAILVLVSERIE
jgi:hypothetical protein